MSLSDTASTIKQSTFTNLAVCMCLIIVMANIAANKITVLFGVALDCGFLFFPLTYLVADIAHEKLGKSQANALVFYGFVAGFVLAIGLYVIKLMPIYQGWHNQEALDKFFGLSTRIIVGSLSSYLIGLYLNTYVFGVLRQKMAGRAVLFRFFCSTAAGALIESMLFYSIAFYGLVDNIVLLKIIVVQYAIKLFYNAIFAVLVTQFLFKKPKAAVE